MLSYLSVKNLAIIENIEVSFEDGMTALTGETGAGKSLLIDAIGLLLGDRASSDVVRSGAPFCEVEGLFTNLRAEVVNALADIGIDCPDEECLISRKIKPNAANLIQINRKTVTLQDLRHVTTYLADIHTQHDTARLINPNTYVELLDAYGNATNALTAYQTARKHYLSVLEETKRLRAKKEDTIARMDMLVYQRDELKKHHLDIEEENHIEARLSTLRNFDKIYQGVKESLSYLKEKEALEAIYDAAATLENVGEYDAQYAALSERIKSAYYELDDAQSSLIDLMETLDFNPDELETLETRKHALDTLKRKYGKSISELIDLRDSIEETLTSFEDYDAVLNKQEMALSNAFEKAKKTALTLTEVRQRDAAHLASTLQALLADLELKDASFDVLFDSKEPTSLDDASVFKKTGIESVDFLLSVNKGEAMKPLSHVASGGELSRIMLALKALLAKHMGLSLMIFDEIDTGVSGFVAGQVAAKIASIAKTTQVITITHLPQVAAVANHHYNIVKDSDALRTRAKIHVLDDHARIEALAAMISSDRITASARARAKELLKP